LRADEDTGDGSGDEYLPPEKEKRKGSFLDGDEEGGSSDELNLSRDNTPLKKKAQGKARGGGGGGGGGGKGGRGGTVKAGAHGGSGKRKRVTSIDADDRPEPAKSGFLTPYLLFLIPRLYTVKNPNTIHSFPRRNTKARQSEVSDQTGN
jgi:hypothetical protein